MVASFVLNVLNTTCFNVGSIKYNRKMHEIEANAGEGVQTVGPLPKDSPVESDLVIKIKYIVAVINKDT